MIRCPRCEAPVDEPTGRCEEGHELLDGDGVLRLVPPSLAERLDALAVALAADRRRRGLHPIPPNAIRDLPDGAAVAGDPEWRLRRLDHVLIRRLLADTAAGPRRVLDVGAWNGWLSGRLAADGHAVTGVEYLVGPEMLGAHALAAAPWRAVQLDLEDLGRLDERFDLVVLNRGLQFSPDPVRLVRVAADRLAPGGLLVATGLAVYRSRGHAAGRVAARRAAFRAHHGIDLFLRPAKGYLDGADVRRLDAAGLTVRWMPGLGLANLRALIDPRRPSWRYGLLQAPR